MSRMELRAEYMETGEPVPPAGHVTNRMGQKGRLSTYGIRHGRAVVWVWPADGLEAPPLLGDPEDWGVRVFVK